MWIFSFYNQAVKYIFLSIRIQLVIIKQFSKQDCFKIIIQINFKLSRLIRNVLSKPKDLKLNQISLFTIQKQILRVFVFKNTNYQFFIFAYYIRKTTTNNFMAKYIIELINLYNGSDYINILLKKDKKYYSLKQYLRAYFYNWNRSSILGIVNGFNLNIKTIHDFERNIFLFKNLDKNIKKSH
ncbi:hypothetical protein PCK1_002874 [Pneumocystis canis]|nr:hypothetical protein PCK1_002874 [Pneumocystis canis]